jgi:hypothetical protein
MLLSRMAQQVRACPFMRIHGSWQQLKIQTQLFFSFATKPAPVSKQRTAHAKS